MPSKDPQDLNPALQTPHVTHTGVTFPPLLLTSSPPPLLLPSSPLSSPLSHFLLCTSAAVGHSAALSENALWASVEGIERGLPEGSELDSLLPHLEEPRLLGVLYSMPLVGGFGACLLREGQLVNHVPCGSRDEARR